MTFAFEEFMQSQKGSINGWLTQKNEQKIATQQGGRAIIYGRNGVKQKMKSITSSIYVH